MREISTQTHAHYVEPSAYRIASTEQESGYCSGGDGVGSCTNGYQP